LRRNGLQTNGTVTFSSQPVLQLGDVYPSPPERRLNTVCTRSASPNGFQGAEEREGVGKKDAAKSVLPATSSQ